MLSFLQFCIMLFTIPARWHFRTPTTCCIKTLPGMDLITEHVENKTREIRKRAEIRAEKIIVKRIEILENQLEWIRKNQDNNY